MINFPDSPSLNQSYSVGTMKYVWDGTKWVSSYTPTPSATLGFAITEESISASVGDNKLIFRMPYGLNIDSIILNSSVNVVGSSLIVDIEKDGVSIFSTKPEIDSGTDTSYGGSQPGVLSTTFLPFNSKIVVHIDQVGSSTPGKGIKVWMIGTL